jgi:hypothetical protein
VCREAATLLARAGLGPEPEPEEGPLAPARGQLVGVGSSPGRGALRRLGLGETVP